MQLLFSSTVDTKLGGQLILLFSSFISITTQIVTPTRFMILVSGSGQWKSWWLWGSSWSLEGRVEESSRPLNVLGLFGIHPAQFEESWAKNCHMGVRFSGLWPPVMAQTSNCCPSNNWTWLKLYGQAVPHYHPQVNIESLSPFVRSMGQETQPKGGSL